nr:MAG TPA: hypothetical protein [Caudoviricetes sp.]
MVLNISTIEFTFRKTTQKYAICKLFHNNTTIVGY